MHKQTSRGSKITGHKAHGSFSLKHDLTEEISSSKDFSMSRNASGNLGKASPQQAIERPRGVGIPKLGYRQHWQCLHNGTDFSKDSKARPRRSKALTCILRSFLSSVVGENPWYHGTTNCNISPCDRMRFGAAKGPRQPCLSPGLSHMVTHVHHDPAHAWCP